LGVAVATLTTTRVLLEETTFPFGVMVSTEHRQGVSAIIGAITRDLPREAKAGVYGAQISIIEHTNERSTALARFNHSI
jgi:hypothetical protein